MSDLCPLELVDRGSETQRQVGKDLIEIVSCYRDYSLETKHLQILMRKGLILV